MSYDFIQCRRDRICPVCKKTIKRGEFYWRASDIFTRMKLTPEYCKECWDATGN